MDRRSFLKTLGITIAATQLPSLVGHAKQAKTEDPVIIGSIFAQPDFYKIPEGFLLCEGQTLSIKEYPELYLVVSGHYGEDRKNLTFNIPDLRTQHRSGISYILKAKKLRQSSWEALAKIGKP